VFHWTERLVATTTHSLQMHTQTQIQNTKTKRNTKQMIKANNELIHCVSKKGPNFETV